MARLSRRTLGIKLSFSVSVLFDRVCSVGELGLHFKRQVLTALLIIKIKQNKQKRAVSVAGSCFCLHIAEAPFGETERDTETQRDGVG